MLRAAASVPLMAMATLRGAACEGFAVRAMSTFKIEKVLYTAECTSTGGREGTSSSSDGNLQLKLTKPKGLGGPETPGTTNPEQLFASGYSACFIGAMGVAARNQKKTLPADTSVTGVVSIGQGAGGLGLAADLKVKIPGFSKEEAEAIVKEAHTICPYSKATKGNIDVKLTVL